MNDQQPDSYTSYVRRCLAVFVTVLCVTAIMVGISFANLGHEVRIALILLAAAVNALLVAGVLMHLFSEKKLIYVVLAFTVIFFAGLMALPLIAHEDVPKILGH